MVKRRSSREKLKSKSKRRYSRGKIRSKSKRRYSRGKIRSKSKKRYSKSIRGGPKFKNQQGGEHPGLKSWRRAMEDLELRFHTAKSEAALEREERRRLEHEIQVLSTQLNNCMRNTDSSLAPRDMVGYSGWTGPFTGSRNRTLPPLNLSRNY